MKEHDENELSRIVFDAALTVHKVLGPGLLESAYEECLFYELSKTGLKIERQKPLPLVYKEVRMDIGYRLDLLFSQKVIIELKAVETITDVHLAQMLTYLKLSGCKLGMLINFNVEVIKNGVKRVVVISTINSHIFQRIISSQKWAKIMFSDGLNNPGIA